MKQKTNKTSQILNSIDLKEDYKCFKKGFNWHNIPKFTILTGINGSGKTQLLRMINGGRNTVDKLAELAKTLIPAHIVNKGKIESLNNDERKHTAQIKLNCAINCDADFIINDIFEDREGAGCFAWKRFDRDKNRKYLRSKAYFKGIAGDADAHNDYDASWKSFDEIIKKYSTELLVPTRGENYEKQALYMFFKAFTKNDFSRFGYNKYAHNDIHGDGSVHGLTLFGKPVLKEYLSQGEREVLFLVTSLFNARFCDVSTVEELDIKLLLLDEPDAHLNPELAKFLIEILTDIVVKELGIQVIMTTHSASTVAFAGEAIEDGKFKGTEITADVLWMENGEVLWMEGDNAQQVSHKKDIIEITKLLSSGLVLFSDCGNVLEKLFKHIASDAAILLVEGSTDFTYFNLAIKNLHKKYPENKNIEKIKDLRIIACNGADNIRHVLNIICNGDKDNTMTKICLFDNDEAGVIAYEKIEKENNKNSKKHFMKLKNKAVEDAISKIDEKSKYTGKFGFTVEFLFEENLLSDNGIIKQAELTKDEIKKLKASLPDRHKYRWILEHKITADDKGKREFCNYVKEYAGTESVNFDGFLETLEAVAKCLP